MAFGMKVTSGDFLPIVKYDARAGKFFKMDKRPDGGSDAIELPLGTKFALDTGSLEAGYVMFGPQGPVRHMVPYTEGVQLPAQPQDKDADGKMAFRPGFYAKVVGNALDGVREWCSNAAVLLNAMDELYQQVMSAPETAGGKIPLIAIVSTIAVKSGTGTRSSTNYAPVLKLEAWVDRPDVLGPRTVAAPHAHMTTQAAQTMAAASVPPAATQAQGNRTPDAGYAPGRSEPAAATPPASHGATPPAGMPFAPQVD